MTATTSRKNSDTRNENEKDKHQQITPSARLLVKFFGGSVSFGAILAVAILAVAFSEADAPMRAVSVPLLGLFAVIQLPIWFAAWLYYNSLSYEIHRDEVVVKSGILTRSVKHVPFRTVTNISTTRGPLDQLLGIGTLAIETAGGTGATPEEQLIGLDDVQGMYERVARRLREFRGAMSADQSSEDPLSADSASDGQQRAESDTIRRAMLDELRQIRKHLEQQS